MIEGAPDMLTYRQNLSALTFYEMHLSDIMGKRQKLMEIKTSTQVLLKHRKNCECCPGHYLIVNQYSSI